MGRWAVILGGIVVLAVIAGGLTEVTLALGHRGAISDDALVRPKSSARPTPTVTSSPTPSATPAPTATPTLTPVLPTATTNSFVHMRAGNSTSTAILTDLNGGTVVQLLPYSDAQWQKVQYNGLVGYIFKSYLAY